MIDELISKWKAEIPYDQYLSYCMDSYEKPNPKENLSTIRPVRTKNTQQPQEDNAATA
jgi:hypothetical protein